MTVEHLLQDCRTHQNPWAETWSADTPLQQKLFGPVESLQRTVVFVEATGVPVSVNKEAEELTSLSTLIFSESATECISKASGNTLLRIWWVKVPVIDVQG